MKSFQIIKADLPEWYRLGSTGTTLRIDVHPAVMPDLMEHSTRLGNCASVGSYPLPAFVPLGGSQWGYGANIRQTKIGNGWLRFSVRCPAGSLDDPATWSALYAAVASIKLLLDILSVTDRLPETGPPQLFLVTGICCDTGIGGASLFVSVSAYTARWIEQHIGIDTRPVRQLMRRAFKRMFGRRMSSEHRCRFRPPKYLHLETLGSATGLDPDLHGIGDLVTGYELHPHNMDSPLQSLSLLVGLGALSDLIRSNP